MKPRPTRSEASACASEARRERLAAALRANLKKRKAQARERATSDGSASPKSKRP